MSSVERLKRENEPKSTRIASKLFRIFVTRSAETSPVRSLIASALKVCAGGVWVHRSAAVEPW